MIQHYIAEILCRCEIDEFCDWAFGNISDSLPQDVFVAWNKIHGDKLKLHEDDIIQNDLPKMVALWRETL